MVNNNNENNKKWEESDLTKTNKLLFKIVDALGITDPQKRTRLAEALKLINLRNSEINLFIIKEFPLLMEKADKSIRDLTKQITDKNDESITNKWLDLLDSLAILQGLILHKKVEKVLTQKSVQNDNALISTIIESFDNKIETINNLLMDEIGIIPNMKVKQYKVPSGLIPDQDEEDFLYNGDNVDNESTVISDGNSNKEMQVYDDASFKNVLSKIENKKYTNNSLVLTDPKYKTFKKTIEDKSISKEKRENILNLENNTELKNTYNKERLYNLNRQIREYNDLLNKEYTLNNLDKKSFVENFLSKRKKERERITQDTSLAQNNSNKQLAIKDNSSENQLVKYEQNNKELELRPNSGKKVELITEYEDELSSNEKVIQDIPTRTKSLALEPFREKQKYLKYKQKYLKLKEFGNMY